MSENSIALFFTRFADEAKQSAKALPADDRAEPIVLAGVTSTAVTQVSFSDCLIEP